MKEQRCTGEAAATNCVVLPAPCSDQMLAIKDMELQPPAVQVQWFESAYCRMCRSAKGPDAFQQVNDASHKPCSHSDRRSICGLLQQYCLEARTCH